MVVVVVVVVSRKKNVVREPEYVAVQQRWVCVGVGINIQKSSSKGCGIIIKLLRIEGEGGREGKELLASTSRNQVRGRISRAVVGA